MVDVQRQRDYEVNWRFISLKVINENLVADWYDDAYKAGHRAGLQALRVADAIRLQHDNAAVGRFYTACGEIIHVGRLDRTELREQTVEVLRRALGRAGLPEDLLAHADDESHDAHIRAETALAFERTGKDVGTPILTFHPGADNEASFFGPVISKAPKGDEAVRLWDAIETIATASGMAELKRSNRGRLDFD